MFMQAEFIASAVTGRDFPTPGIPEVVLAGRSNVGKSSLINSLAGRRGLARTSSTPGKTRSINFYRFDDAFVLVDLPGYGYAKAGKDVSRLWGRLIERYFRGRPTVALVIHLLDARLAPTRLDMELEVWLERLRLPRLIVATKADKIGACKRAAQLRAISGSFGGQPVVLASAVTGLGCREIRELAGEAARRLNPRERSPRA
jgi:GTP-binding protein